MVDVRSSLDFLIKFTGIEGLQEFLVACQDLFCLTAIIGLRLFAAKHEKCCKYCNDVVLFASENELQPVTDALGNVIRQPMADTGWYEHGQYPFVFDPLYSMEGTPCGFGYIDVGKDAQAYIDRGNQAIMQNMLANAISLANRRMIDEQANLIASQLEKSIDINRMLNRCNRNFPCQYTLPYYSDTEDDMHAFPLRKIKIAIARDPAFNFTYQENISRLKKIGEVTHFSPLYGYELPEADLIYIPGGYPELFARQLHRRRKMLESLKEYAEAGGKIFAECGGMVFLGRTLKSKENGTAYPMSNILPIDFTMPSVPKLVSGYRKMSYKDTEFKGYEFHYSTILQDDTPDIYRIASITNQKGSENVASLYRYKNVIASYTHWYWGEKDLLKLWL